ncbi:MAG: F-type H+-transporting ATPase subunit a [Acidobacteriota bacterium]|nr:F-type H+-transporting ATPase subunit a [Acidobacteriota bacterium]
MFFLLQEGHATAAQHTEAAQEAARQTGETLAPVGEHTAEAAHHLPVIVQWVNQLIGEPIYRFEVSYTKPLWDKFFAYFGTNAEEVFGRYTPETAVPWYTVMFVIACILSVVIIMLLRRRMSSDDPTHGQQTLEVSVLAIRGMLADVVGEHGLKYFPVVATFGILILISNLMGFFPLFMSPTASTSVTFALGLSSFIYYNGIGIKENGLFGHLRHFAGPIWWIAPLLFVIEIIGNMIRPLSLGIRLFGNMFADEQVAENIANLFPPYTNWLVPVALMPLGVFVAFIQTFVFVLLSMVYLSEVSHPPHHGEHHVDSNGEEVLDTTSDNLIAPVLG